MDDKIRMINEQGDLGLWDTELSEKDQKKYKEQLESEKKEAKNNK